MNVLRSEEHGYFIELPQSDIYNFMYGDDKAALDPDQKVQIIANF